MLEMRGRKDDRIKIRGNRIEVGEIERCLETLPGVERAAVVALPRANNEPILAAFVKVTDKSLTADRLRQTVRVKLPVHMTPSQIIFLNELPYRGNKIDRQALREYRPER
jgi:acyl-coenzyme A synthetase/AMP-(fatty) acid ligase